MKTTPLYCGQDITREQSGNDPVTVALLRHPAADIAAGICYGRLDVPLSEGWQLLLPGLVRRLASTAPEAIHSSPLRRCAEVARALAVLLDLPVVLDERLLELDFGAWEGLRWELVPRRLLDDWAADPCGFRPPGGESGASLIARSRDFAAMLQQQSRPCLVVSHGGPLRLLPALLSGDGRVDLLAPAPAMGQLEIKQGWGVVRSTHSRDAPSPANG